MVIKIKKGIQDSVTLTRLAKSMLPNANSGAGIHRQISKRTILLQQLQQLLLLLFLWLWGRFCR